jgi:16S rRNA (guanine966-N2)-methyltransferase
VRVTGGALGGRRLRVPRGGARPTSDRVREALFARLELLGTAVLDLYAGSGSLAIEAVSRGAESAVCIERAAGSLAALRENLQRLELRDRIRVVAGDAVASVRRLGRAGERFDLVLLDPPYASGQGGRALEALVASGVLAPGAVVVYERGRGSEAPAVAGLALLDERRYGDTVLTRFAAAAGNDRE